MTSLEMASFLIGLAILIACTVKRVGTPGETLKNRLPELIVGLYLLGRGIFSALAAGHPLGAGQSLPIVLVFAPAAAAISQSKFREGSYPIDIMVWLTGGIILTATWIIWGSAWRIEATPNVSIPMIVIAVLAAAMIKFRHLSRFILGFAILIWAIDLFRLPDSAVLSASILMGLVTLLMTIRILPDFSRQPYAFELTDLLNSVSSPFMILDTLGRIVYANDAFLKLCRREKESILQADAVELFDIPSDWRFKTGSSGNFQSVRCHLLGKEGLRVPVILRLNEIRSGRNEIRNILCLVSDESERENLENRIKNESVRFTALYDTSVALSSSLEIKDVLKAIARAAESLTRADSCTIMSLDHSRQVLKPIYSSEETFKAEVMNFEMPVGKGLTGTVVSDGKPRILNFDEEDQVSVLVPGTKEEEESLLAVPLKAKDMVIGALTLYKNGRRKFEDEDIRVLTVFASQASAIIENSRLYMKLKASEKLYKFSVDLAGDAIFFVDPETGKISDSNDMAQKLFKFSKAELASMHIWELQPESQMLTAKRLWHEVKKIGWGKLGEIDYQGRDGTRIPATVTVSILYTGEASSIQWIVRDISEHKRALERVGFLHQIFERLEEPILITDIKGRTLYANEAFGAVFKVSKDQVAKGTIGSLGLANSRLGILAAYWEKLSGKEFLTERITIGQDNAQKASRMVSIVPYRSEHGAVKYHVWLFGPSEAEPTEAKLAGHLA